MSDSLGEIATQASLAELVGCTRQAIQKLSSSIDFPRNGTNREWLLLYCDRIRQEAAGRGGESQKNLTNQRIAESEQKTLAMSLDNMEKLKLLVPVEVMSGVFDEFAAAVPISFNTAAEKILSAIESKYSISINDELVHEPLRSASSRLATTARKLSERIRQSS